MTDNRRPIESRILDRLAAWYAAKRHRYPLVYRDDLRKDMHE